MTPLLAYFGPETVLPATSIIATVVGVVLMLGKNSIRWCVGLVTAPFARKGKADASTPAPASTSTPAPHFARQAEARATEAEEAGR
ncbi:hypothetical protein [Paludisphaera sp.]|uniref:hypothetical protein n=1 Tax=Paludisphaera sp. TaxID=2017432 RepID=UPI00301E45F1